MYNIVGYCRLNRKGLETEKDQSGVGYQKLKLMYRMEKAQANG